MVVLDKMEILSEPVGCQLTDADQAWLAGFGVDPIWQEDPERIRTINRDIEIGGVCLKGVLDQTRIDDVVAARERFFDFVGLDGRPIEKLRQTTPTLVPTSTFIATQRILFENKLDGPKIVTAQPLALMLSTRAVAERMRNLNELGFDARKVVNAHPSVINLGEETLVNRVRNLKALGLDAVKIGNRAPSVLGFTPESTREKMENLAAFGLDAAKIVNTYPQAISYASDSVEAKMCFLRRSAKVLGWQFDAEELVESYPGILGFSVKKLQILRRIVAENVDLASNSTKPDFIRSRLITPLENYMIALDGIGDESVEAERVDIRTLVNKAARVHLNARERRARARELASSGKLGRIGVMYLRYIS